MPLVTVSQLWRSLRLACGAAALIACGEAAEEDREPAFEVSPSECGDSLGTLLDPPAPSGGTGAERARPPLGATYSEALAEWPRGTEGCGLGAFTGSCADGKRLLYRNGGFTSEIRYFDGERLVGVVSSGDVGFCPSLCPFSHYYGSPDSVRCEAPALEDLCADSILDASETEAWLPFANGSPPGGCWE